MPPGLQQVRGNGCRGATRQPSAQSDLLILRPAHCYAHLPKVHQLPGPRCGDSRSRGVLPAMDKELQLCPYGARGEVVIQKGAPSAAALSLTPCVGKARPTNS